MAAQFVDIYEEHVWAVYGLFAYRGLAVQDAEDLTQLTFERALAAWGRPEPLALEPARREASESVAAAWAKRTPEPCLETVT